MPSDEPVVTQWEVDGALDLLAAFDAQLLDHLVVDDARTIVLYRDAILDVSVGEGDLSTARAVTVTLQGFSRRVRDPEPDAVLAAFCEEVVATTDTDRR